MPLQSLYKITMANTFADNDTIYFHNEKKKSENR